MRLRPLASPVLAALLYHQAFMNASVLTMCFAIVVAYLADLRTAKLG